MSEHVPFNFQSVDELRQRIQELGLDLELSEDFSPLYDKVTVNGFELPNRFVVLPMEGADGNADGTPAELTLRRYRRFASGGSGLLWMEATAVVQESRANPRQLWITQQTMPAFASMVEQTHKAAREAMGPNHRPMLIVQLTHSGRYSKPGLKPAPIIAHHSAVLDPTHNLPPDYPLISDDTLERLEDTFVEAALLAQKAGFDGVDIKACHRYLVSELHASFTRENSRYGGLPWENRSRFFKNVVGKIKSAAPNLLVTARMNAYDAIAYPYGFGVDRNDVTKADLTEPMDLVRFLYNHGARVVNITIGNPYFNPNVNRPFDMPTIGAPVPKESPLFGVSRFVNIVRQIQQTFPDMAVIGGGYSWLRQFLPHVASANVRNKWVSLIGLGRMAFAYPQAPRDLKDKGALDPQKVCVACSACTQIMRDGGTTGCVPRDAAVYEPIYKEGRSQALDSIIQMAATCRQCTAPTCISHCPAQVNIPKFIGEIANKKFRQAYETLRESNTLAAVCGCVCPAEVQCEGACIHQHYHAAVPIRHLQQWVTRKAIEEGWAAETRASAASSGRRVAVVGAGPAGIAAAEKLAAAGHAVTLFDKSRTAGGAAREVIPSERLTDNLIDREIRAIIASHGDRITFRNTLLSESFNLDSIMSEGFDAVLLCAGLSESQPLPKASRPASGVESALSFLSRTKRGEKVSGVVRVLGGGNSAIDAATSAKKAGAADVSIVYRRSFAEMPAWPVDRDKAIMAGVDFLTLTAPLDYLSDTGGKLTGLKVIRTKLGNPDEKGRRRPEPMAGTEHTLPADLVIEALGQQISKSLKTALAGVQFTTEGLVWTDMVTMQTSRPRVFAAGDIVNGGTTVVRAVAEGARAAHQINRLLAGHAKTA